MILKSILENEKRQQTVLMYLNDQNQDHANNLRTEIYKNPNIKTLKHEPVIMTNEINDNIDKHYEVIKNDPIFSFIDPFGYKGLSLGLINKAIKNWGCDCVFFFNYPRINAGISNSCVKNHINALFGEERTNNLLQEVKDKKPALREEIVLKKLKEAIKEMGGEFILPFRFRKRSGKSTSHYIIFISKHVLGYNIMKGIMANESSTHENGVASFERSLSPQFIFDRKLDSLIEELPLRFAGRTISMINIYNEHNVDTLFIAKNYKEA